MRWLISGLSGLLLVLLLSYGAAGELSPIHPIKAGEVSPVEGVVVPAERFRELLEQANDYRVLIEAHELQVAGLRERMKTIAASAIAEEKLRHEGEVAKMKLDIEEYKRRLEVATNPPFWKSGEFNRLVGMILGIAVGIAAGGI